MIEWMMIVQISCTEPRLTFREFYSAVHHASKDQLNWLYRNGEQVTSVMERIGNTFADYADYTIMRNDKCGMPNVNK